MITQEQIKEAAKNNSIIDCDFIDGANWAIQQLQPKWIKIESEDDLPKEDGLYFICINNVIQKFTASKREICYEWENTGVSHYIFCEDVLPQPPQD